MNYSKQYQLLIDTRTLKHEERLADKRGGVYYENHHILPRCYGGTNDKANLVLLTAREHFIAHHLLWRMHRDKQMAYAFCCMSATRKFRVTGRQYEWFKTLRSVYYSGANSPRGFLGKHHDDSAKDRMRSAKQGANNPMYGLGSLHPNTKRVGKNNPNYALDPWKNPSVLRKPAAVWLWIRRDELLQDWVDQGCPHWYAFGKWACDNVGGPHHYIPHNFAVMVKWFKRVEDGSIQ